MSVNPIKYNTSVETRALRKDNFYIGTRDSGKSTVGGYYSGVNPPQNGYVVYLNKSGGPSTYVATSDAELVTLTNTIAKTSYTTVAECFAYFAGQGDKMVVNKTYPFMWTDGLVMNLDASFLPSFPRTGTSWYDLSTSVNTGTAINGPTFNSSGYFTLDGADDYFTLGNNSSLWVTGDQTLEFVVYPKRRDRRQNFYNKAYGGEGTITYETDGSLSYYYGTAGGDASPYQGFGSTSSAMSTLNLWYHVALVRDLSSASKTLKWYINGVLNTQTPASYSAAVASSNPVAIGTGYTNPFQGDILYARQYSTALTQSQLLQNYYQAQVPTDGLALALDAGNLVSYPRSGSVWYDMTGGGLNAIDGNFQVESGGNGYALYSGNTATTSTTEILNTDYHSIVMIVRFKATGTYPNGYTGSWDKFFTYAPAGTDRSPGVWRYPNNRVIHWTYDPGNTGCDFGKDASSNEFDLNKDYFITVTKNSGVAKAYVNGVNVNTTSVAAPKTAGSATIQFFEYYPANLMEIKLCFVYSNRVLVDNEIIGMYRTYQSRLII